MVVTLDLKDTTIVEKADICKEIINECHELFCALGEEHVKFVKLENYCGYKLSKRLGVFVLTITVLLNEKEGCLSVSTQTFGNAEFQVFTVPETEADICRLAYKVIGLGLQTLNYEIRSLDGLLGSRV